MTGTKITLTLYLLFLAGISGLKCQVCGISGSKLNSSCAGVIDHNSLEFEILYSFEKSNYHWDHQGSLIPLTPDSELPYNGSDLFFRATFGVFRNAELGATVDKEADEASLGFKWRPFMTGKGSVALAGGVRFGFGGNSDPPEAAEEPLTKTVTLALLYSREITTSISFDLNAGYNISLTGGSGLSSGCFDLCGDFGWHLFDGKMQAIIGAELRSGLSTEDMEKLRLVTLYPGVTLTTGQDYEILIALPCDIYGINHPKRNAVMCSLTLTLH